MRTELKKPFTYGFILSEQELRRIHDTMVQQMKRTGKSDFGSFFEVTYKNGVRTEKASLDEITLENNRGEWMIQGLKMAVFSHFPLRETQIEIEFRVPPPPPSRESNLRPYSVQYYVVGDERDWVFLTSSLLDDRLASIKQLPIFYYGIAAIAVGFVMLIVFLTIILSPTSSYKFSVGYEIVALLGSSLIMIGGIAAMYGFRLYNFCWGDYLRTFTQRRTIGRYVINGFIITLLLSIIGSVIGTLFFLR